MSDLIIHPMTRAEALSAIQQVKDGLYTARRHAQALKEREGWKALGYASLAECFEHELGYSWQYGYRLIAAAEVQYNLSPKGEITIPERHARELHKLSPAEQVEAYRVAQEMATSEGAKAPSTRHVQQSVELLDVRKQVLEARYFPIAQAMTTGLITPLVAQAMVIQVEQLAPKKRGYIMQIIAAHGLTCAELIPPIAEMFDRPAGKESYVLMEVLKTGTLGGTPLKAARMDDLHRACEEARLQHIAEAEEARRAAQPAWTTPATPVNITVWLGHREKTMRQINLLGEPAVEILRMWLMEG